MESNNIGNKASGLDILNEILNWIEAIAFAVVISLLIRGFVFETVVVDGSSMENTLQSGDRLILYTLGYYFTPPKRGDIVVLQVREGMLKFIPFLEEFPLFKKAIPDLTEIDYIKRVVGVPGDTIEFIDGKVYVNGDPMREPYSNGETFAGMSKITVEENTVFVMGDNRKNSRDSRELGLVPYNRIKGKAIFRIWPLKKSGSIY